MNVRFTAKTLCAFLAVLAAAAIALLFDAPPAQAIGVVIPRGHRSAKSPSNPLTVTRTVTTPADSGAGSLRDAIASASPGDTINFSLTLPATITLTSGELSIAKNLTINGPGASLLAVSGGNTYRVFSIGSNQVTISGITIRDGNDTSPGYGGGIFNAGTLTLTNSTVMSNTTVFVGGGIYNEAGAFTIVDRSTIAGNNGIGGGIYNLGFFTITNSTLTGNFGSVSGIWSAGNSTLVLTNTAISGEQDTAIFVVSNAPGAASATLWNSDIISNTGMGIELDVGAAGVTSTLTLHNSIVAYNGGGNFAVFSGTVTSLGYNLSDGTIPNATTGDQQNVLNIRIAPLANNGGATQTMSLLPGSPAINAGSNSGCPATDQRGISRPRTTQNPCDIGAFENSYLFLPLIKK